MRRTSLKRHAPVLGAQEVLMAVRLRQPRAQPARDRHGHRVAHQRPPLRLPRTAAPHSGRAAHAYPAPQLGAGLCRHQAERLRARAARAGPGTAHSRRRLVAGRGHAGPGAAACKHECGQVRRHTTLTAYPLLAVACQPGCAPHAGLHAGGRCAARGRAREGGSRGPTSRRSASESWRRTRWPVAPSARTGQHGRVWPSGRPCRHGRPVSALRRGAARWQATPPLLCPALAGPPARCHLTCVWQCAQTAAL